MNYSFRYYQGYQNSIYRKSSVERQDFNPFAKVGHEPEATDLLVDKAPEDFEYSIETNFRADYAINDHWMLGLIVPFKRTVVHYDRTYDVSNIFRPVFDTTIDVSGFGDPIVSVDRIINLESGEFKHYLRPGLGLKLPFGQTKLENEYDEVLLPGSGSTDVILKLYYQIRYKNSGINLLPNYRYNGRGVNDYQMGSGTNMMIEAFYSLPFGERFNLIPHGGVYFERIQKDYRQNIEVQLTGRNTDFLHFGVDFRFGNFMLVNSYQMVISQKLNGNQIEERGRFNITLLYNLN